MNTDNILLEKLSTADTFLVSQCFEDSLASLDKETVNALPVTILAKIISKLNSSSAYNVFTLIEKVKLNKIVSLMLPADLIRIFSSVSSKQLSLFLSEMDEQHKKEIEDILKLPPDCAGSIMDVQLIALAKDDTVESAISKIKLAKRKIIDLYVVDAHHRLVGRVAADSLLSEPADTNITKFMVPVTESISMFEKFDEIKTMFDKSKVFSIPVVGIDGELLGVIRYRQIVQAIESDAAQDLMAMSGVSREERALSPTWHSVKSRLPWLFINLGTAFLAASIVGVFENTIARVTALAVLMPVVAGQSGNTGAQAMAVTMRGLALKEIRIRNFPLLLFKELRVGFLNGAAIAVFTSLGVLLWNPDKLLALILGISMIGAMILASVTGALIPIILTALGRDPAQSSSIILTTMTDVISFFSFLGLATLFVIQLSQAA